MYIWFDHCTVCAVLWQWFLSFLPVRGCFHVLYAELHQTSVAVAALFCPFSQFAAIVTTKTVDIRFYLYVCFQQMHLNINNKTQYLIFAEQFVPFTQLLLESHLHTDRDLRLRCNSDGLLSRSPASTGWARQIFYRVKRKSSLVSHFPLPADPWPCCTSAAPALAAARHPPALPGAAAEHPDEREGRSKRRPQYTCTVWPELAFWGHAPTLKVVIHVTQGKLIIYTALEKLLNKGHDIL